MCTSARTLFYIFSLIVLGLSLSVSASAETLTLQLPISRGWHTFSLWELNTNPADPGQDRLNSHEELEIPAGRYRVRPITGLNLVGGYLGGYYDSLGVWQPGDGAFFQGFIDRTPGTTTFFVNDDTTGEVVHANTPTLVNSAWFPDWPVDPMVYFSLPADRASHQFLINAFGTDPDTMLPWSGWWSLTTASPVSWIGPDGTDLSYGFFEAWSTVPRWVEAVDVYDLTSYQVATASGSADLSGPSTTWTEVSYDFWPAISVFIATGQPGQTLWLVSPGGAPTVLESEWNAGQGAYGVQCTVGYEQEFWLRRPSDGMTSPPFYVSWGAGIPSFDASYIFGSGPYDDWQLVSVRASPARTSLSIKRLANDEMVPIQWGALSGINVTDPAGLSSTWVEFYDGSAYINAAGGWTVIDSNGTDLGQGPDFIDWPVFQNPTSIVWLPATWAGNVPVVAESGDSVTYLSQSSGLFDDFFKPVSYWVTLNRVQVPIPWHLTNSPGTVQLIDNETGELSPPLGDSFNLSQWHPRANLLLKISATRWHHVLQVRCANGDIFPIAKHNIQGDWSFDPVSGKSWFNNYGYFDASAHRRNGISWYLYDVTTEEYLDPDSSAEGSSFIEATHDTDSDGDGLPDWYEQMIGTDPWDTDTDNDGISDGAEVAANSNPRAGNAGSNSTLKVFTPLE